MKIIQYYKYLLCILLIFNSSSVYSNTCSPIPNVYKGRSDCPIYISGSPTYSCVYAGSWDPAGGADWDFFSVFNCSEPVETSCSMISADGWNTDGTCSTKFNNKEPEPDYLSKGTPVDCVGGSVVYVPMSCPVDQMLKDFKAPAPGQSRVCSDGSVVEFPNSCFLKFFLDNAVLAGTKIKNTAYKYAGNLVSELFGPSGSKVQHEVQFLDKNTGQVKYGVLEAPAQKAMVADSLSAYLKTPESSNLRTQVSTSTSGFYSVNTETGLLRVVGSASTARDLSPNESLDVFSRYSIPVSSTQLSPHIDHNFTPVAPQVIDDLTTDYVRLNDNDSLDQPRFINPSWLSAGPVGLSSSQPLPSSQPVIEIASPTTNPFGGYTQPVAKPATSTQTSTSTTPQTTTTTTTDPVTGIQTTTTPQTNSTTQTTMDYGQPPPNITYNNDYPLYIPWLKEILPQFEYDAGDWLPMLPSGGCTYEVHTMIFGRNFDLVPCPPLAPLRAVLGWAFSVLTAWLVFRLVFKSTA